MPIAHNLEGRRRCRARLLPGRFRHSLTPKPARSETPHPALPGSTRTERRARSLVRYPPTNSHSLIATAIIRNLPNSNKTNHKVFSNRNKNTYFQAPKQNLFRAARLQSGLFRHSVTANSGRSGTLRPQIAITASRFSAKLCLNPTQSRRPRR